MASLWTSLIPDESTLALTLALTVGEKACGGSLNSILGLSDGARLQSRRLLFFILLTGVWVCVIFSFFLFTYELCTEAEFI